MGDILDRINDARDAFDTTLPASEVLAAAADEIERLRGKIEEALRCLDGEPEYHSHGMGCGLEDRDITDRYDAMAHGWEKAMERVYGENIEWAKEALTSALSTKGEGDE